jgi:tetratricopeptide (TPR) repeat protein
MEESLYADSPMTERPRVHHGIARSLEAFYGDDAERHLPEIAHNLFEGGDETALDALSYASRAAKQAADRLEWEAAVENYERSFTLLERLGADRAARCAFLLEYGEALGHSGERDRACTRIREAIRLAHDIGDWDALLRASFALVNWRTAPAPRASSKRGAETKARALGDEIETLIDPDDLDTRTALAKQMVAHAADAGVPDLLLEARNWQMLSALERADGDEFRESLESALIEARDGKLPPGSLSALRAFQTISGGSADTAERLMIDALAGGEDHATVPDQMLVGLLLAVAERRGRYRELATLWQSMASLDPMQPGWIPYLTRLHARIGRLDDARASLDRIGRRGFDTIIRAWSWLSNVVLLAEACAITGATEWAPQLRAMLDPYAHRFATFPLGFTHLHPVAREIALLHQAEGNTQEAGRWFDLAVKTAERVGFRYPELLATVEHARMLGASDDAADRSRAASMARTVLKDARALGFVDIARTAESIAVTTAPPRRTKAVASAPGAGELGTFRREGEMWTLTFGDGAPMRLADSKGLACIHTLLSNAGREFHVLELMNVVEGGTGARNAPAPRADGTAVDTGAGMPLLDEDAKRAYKSRIEHLQEEMDEATAWGDPERAARARAELDSIAHELSRSVGLAGRDRTGPGPAERARVNITRVVKRALDTISEFDPLAGRFLSDSIKRGTFCSYDPDPARPVKWDL